MSTPLFSIIVPLFNRDILVRDTLDSLLRQTIPDWEAIIVDDGSADRSCETVQEYSQKDSRIRLFYRPADRTKGPSACRNFGFENASGSYIYYLDSDDLLEKRFCENAARAFRTNPNLDFLGVQCVYFSGRAHELLQKDFPIQSHDDEIRSHYLEKTLWLQTESFCWKKSFLDLFPRHWPEDQRVGEDRVCYYRLLTSPCKGAWEQDVIQVYHRTGKTENGTSDQLTPQINRNPVFAAERVLTVGRLIDAFRDSHSLTPSSEVLLLNNALSTLRGVLSYNHTVLAEECFHRLVDFARETNRIDFIRKAQWYIRFKLLFRIHRIPIIEMCYGHFRCLLKGKKR